MKRLFICLLLLSSFALAQSSEWERWLSNEGFYLLNSEQKTKFRALPDPQKAAYIEDLWAGMDPDPLTPANEFKVEYEKRFDYAKKHYGIPSDRAKIYLLLGAPNGVESHPNSDKYYPLEVWSYYSLGIRGLPPSLDLIFFKRWGTGDYRLYSPVFDGFKALVPGNLDVSNPRMQSQLRSLFDPTVLQAAESITTGAGPNESEIIRSQLEAPNAMSRYIVQQKQRPNVETTIVYQGFNADVYAYSYPQESGIYRTSIAIAISPKYLTFEKDEDAGIYRGRVDLTGKILDEKGNEVLRINDSPAMQMNAADFERAKGYFFSYLFDSYLLPGKYRLDCLFRDFASNAAGKLEKGFEVKPIGDDLDLLPLLLSYKAQPASQEAPFGYNFLQYFPKENESFNTGQQILLFTTLMNPKRIKLQGLWQLQISAKKNGAEVLSLNEDLPISSASDVNLSRRVPLENLAPGDYLLTLKISQAGKTYVSESPLKITSEPQVLGRMRVTASSNNGPDAFHANIALQHLLRGELDDAARHVRIALDFAPASYAARSLSARIQKAKGDTAGAIATYDKLLAESPGDSEGFFLVGKWSLELQNWQNASDSLKKAMELGYYNTELLNDLAKAEIQLGNKAQAVDYWRKSLALNSNQPDIQKQISTYKQ
jgi:GWxTD domain-containing protein